MTITTTTPSNWTVLTLDGPIDHHSAQELGAELEPLSIGGNLAIAFTGVEYITSSGFRVLMKAAREQHTRGGRLVLGNLSAPLLKYFEIAGLERMFEYTDDVAKVTTS